MPLPKILRRLTQRRHGAVVLFIAAYLLFAFLVRCVLLIKVGDEASWGTNLLATFGWGLLYDLGAAAWASLPLSIVLAVLPAGFFERPVGRAATHLALLGLFCLLLFDGVAEWLFWDEFGTRFNFIAVDYLVYTTEVLANIRESYPLPVLFTGIGICAALLDWAAWRTGLPQAWMAHAREGLRPRMAGAAAWGVSAILLGSLLSSDKIPRFENSYNRGLAQDGLWSLFAAFRNNRLDYEEFYLTVPEEQCFVSLREELVQDGSILLAPESPDTLRYVVDEEPEIRPNIIQITVESLSADFLGAFGSTEGLTPNLDALVDKSLFFERFYATGTRTVRGMEALTMSIPPTPGRSIVKRPDNGGMFTLGSVLRMRGYETAFLYGGYGYFDNMNEFFSGNGYRIVDRASVTAQDVTFANAWGACDGDLLRWTLREADEAHERGVPFHFFAMTTSNHRPYSFPDGKIDLPSKVSGRSGAVKYTDYAIGEFLRAASERPWFEDTIFVIVADHCSTSAGRTEIPLVKYHIPLLIYAPGGQVEPGRNSRLMSQMDYAPTLLGLMNWSYPTRFFGHDVTRVNATDSHALVGTYQLLGHIERDQLTILEPKSTVSSYEIDWASLALAEGDTRPDDLNETIAFYQAACGMYRRGTYQQLAREQFERYSELGQQVAREQELLHH